MMRFGGRLGVKPPSSGSYPGQRPPASPNTLAITVRRCMLAVHGRSSFVGTDWGEPRSGLRQGVSAPVGRKVVVWTPKLWNKIVVCTPQHCHGRLLRRAPGTWVSMPDWLVAATRMQPEASAACVANALAFAFARHRTVTSVSYSISTTSVERISTRSLLIPGCSTARVAPAVSGWRTRKRRQFRRFWCRRPSVQQCARRGLVRYSF
jgi:hypothetical protein